MSEENFCHIGTIVAAFCEHGGLRSVRSVARSLDRVDRFGQFGMLCPFKGRFKGAFKRPFKGRNTTTVDHLGVVLRIIKAKPRRRRQRRGGAKISETSLRGANHSESPLMMIPVLSLSRRLIKLSQMSIKHRNLRQRSVAFRGQMRNASTSGCLSLVEPWVHGGLGL